MRYILANHAVRMRAVSAVSQSPDGWVVTIKEPVRSLDQNAKFHALVSDCKGLPWYGKARSADDWKTLFVSGHTIATGGAAEVIPGLEAEFVNIREATSRMNKARSSSLIEYTQAWIASNQQATSAP